MELPDALADHAQAYREATAPWRARLGAAAGAVVVVATLLTARLGTSSGRAGAVALAVGAVAVALAVRARSRRGLADPRAVLARVVAPAAPDEAARAGRALTLLERPSPGTSRALAELHVARALAAIPAAEVVARGRVVAARLRVGAVVLAAAAVGSCARDPFSLVEGADVLAARGGRAPVPLAWLVQPEVVSRPPEYLHMAERADALGEELAVPTGTLLTVRGRPVHRGRQLALSDGVAEVPFVEDGSGDVIARWPLAESTTLRVVARFGDVRVDDPGPLAVTAIPDLAPSVELEGAPRTIRLASDDAERELAVKYRVTDDHGLREVHLVLRSGTREERRVLARLDGEARSDRGGHVLRFTDPFVRRSHAPVEVRVAARDNDAVRGPKWGESAAITLVPPDVGEPDARRLEALRVARRACVDALAPRLTLGDRGQPPWDAGRVATLARTCARRLDEALTREHVGLRVPGRTAARLRVSEQRLRDAERREGAGGPGRAAALAASERLVLVLDAVIRGLGVSGARAAAKELSTSADELALGAAQARAHDADGPRRMDAAAAVLGGGARQLVRLGALGEDLGEIVVAASARVERARAAGDFPHAELAARDLAARLREPDPSFGARGGSGMGQRGEPGQLGSGDGGGEGDEGGGAGGDVDQAFAEAARSIERLAAEHAENMGKTEQALAQGATEDDRRALAEEARAHAERVREAVSGLPTVGSGSDSWTSKGAAARDLAEQMARALEEGGAADAVASGRSALGALDEVKRTGARDALRGRGGERADEAARRLAPEVRWAEEQLAKMKARAAQRARGELGRRGEDEAKLAERAAEVARKAGDAVPEGAREALERAAQGARDAAGSLRQGDPDRAQTAQRDAQARLEAALRELGSKGDEPSGRGEDGASQSDGFVPIPKADAHKGPEEFRRRVLRGLGQPGAGRHRDAVQRYAEGLLR